MHTTLLLTDNSVIQFCFKLGALEVALSKVLSKMLYNSLRNRKQVIPNTKKKLKEKLNELSVDWKEIYTLPFTVTIY